MISYKHFIFIFIFIVLASSVFGLITRGGDVYITNLNANVTGFNDTDNSLNSTGLIIGVNTSVIQERVDGTCLATEAMRVIAQDGTVTCVSISGANVTGFNDTDNSLNYTGLTIGVNTSYIQRRVITDCGTDKYISAIAEAGTATCQSDEDTQVNQTQVWDYMNVSKYFIFQVNWSNIINKFITAVDETYINMVGTTATFNVSKATELIHNESLNSTEADVSYLRLDASNDPVTNNLEVTGNVTATWFNGKHNWTVGDDWNIFDGSTLTFNESKLSTIYYNVTSINVEVGTGSGSLSDIQVYDSVSYNVSEVASDIDFRINFTDVDDFNNIIIRYKSSVEDVAHNLQVQVWEYDDLAWEDYGVLPSTTTYSIVTFGVYDADEHINNSIVQMRIYQDEGVPAKTHLHNFDWVSISKGFGTPAGDEVDPLSIHKDGSIALTANWNAGSFNITAQSFIGDLNWSYVQNAPAFVTNATANTSIDCSDITNAVSDLCTITGGSSAANSTSWNQTNGNVILANPTDNVGINISSPSSALHVNGDINVTNIFYLGGFQLEDNGTALIISAS